MTPDNAIARHFLDAGTLMKECAELLASPVREAAEQVLDTLMHDGKILIAGNGAWSALADTLASYMLTRLQSERIGLPAVSLVGNTAVMTACQADGNADEWFSGQVHTLGKQGDVLCILSATGGCKNLQAAVSAAHDRDMTVIALCGNDGGRIAGLLAETDTLLNVPSPSSLHVLEVHTAVVHALCAHIDSLLLDDL